MKEVTVRIIGMTCGHCAASVENSMSALDGVESVRVSLPTGQARLTLRDESAVSSQRLKEIVENAGFGVVGIDGV